MRKIPAVMATQHPDNACSPFWEKDGDGFVSIYEELEECVSAFQDLGVGEYMWDFEGKYADEAVIDKLFSTHYEFFKNHQIGKDCFLTFRIPNIWHEKGYGLMRALTVILTSEDFARDLEFHAPPLFEAILPMTERADQLMYIQESFQKFAKFKSEVFNHRPSANESYLSIIPLVEGIEHQVNIGDLLREYTKLHEEYFHHKPEYIRPFLAGSDPALSSGLLAKVLSNKIALSEIEKFSTEYNIPCYPIIGVGSLVFRGGLSPDRVEMFVDEYRGVRTVTVQSAFRYDYELEKVKQAIKYLENNLDQQKTEIITNQETEVLNGIIEKSHKVYESTIYDILPDITPFFSMIPKRRERRLHIGLLSYKRKVAGAEMPRAITFTGGLYSLGVPPEFIGMGRVLASLSATEFTLVRKYYKYLAKDMEHVGRYLNKQNLNYLSRRNPKWHHVEKDIEHLESLFGISFGPKTRQDYIYRNITSNIFLSKDMKEEAMKLVVDAAKIRRSLG